MVAEGAPQDEGLQHRGLRLLRLEEERIATVAPHQQDDPRPGAHAAHPDHLAREVDDLIAGEQAADVRAQRGAVAPDDGADRGGQALGLGGPE